MTETAESTRTAEAASEPATGPASRVSATEPGAAATEPASAATEPATGTAASEPATEPAAASTEPATGSSATGPATSSSATEPAAAADGAAPVFDMERRATELAILDALRSVVDPEIGMNVVELALIKQILLGQNETEVKMILTTPFCPYAGSMIAQVQEQVESVVEHPVKVTLLAERWDPRDAGLMW